MQTLDDRLFAEIRRIPLIDPHSHIDPRAPAARGLGELLGYHYYTELAHSAGLAKGRIEDSVGLEQARALAGGLIACRNTIQYHWLVQLAREFFGFPGDDLTTDNVEDLYERVQRATAAKDWAGEVLRRTNLEAIFLTNDFDDPLEGFDRRTYVPCLRTDDLVFRLGDLKVRERLARAVKIEPTNWKSTRDAIGAVFRHFRQGGARACAVSLPPDFEPARPGDADAASALEQVLAGSANEEDARVLAYAVFFHLADRCEEHDLPFDLMIGVHRRVYPDGVHQGQDLFDQRTSLYQFRRLFNEKPNVLFPISVLTHSQNQELASFAWIFPNVVASGHWWYANVPAYIESDLRGRLEAVPANKLIGYYSDAYKLEFVLPKFDMYRRCLARVLSREFVERRGWSEERAVGLARSILRGNVERIFPDK